MKFLPTLLLLLFAAACQPAGEAAYEGDETPSLKEAFADHFMVGAALNPGQFTEADSAGAALVADQFNTITPENHLKWALVHPEPGVYDFEAADAYVAFGEAHDMFIVGHTLVWHSQTPSWVWEDENGDPLSREAGLERMRDHIMTVAGRYQGRIDGWDVVNEALNEDGTLRDSPWRQIIGDDYLEHAFRFAAEAAPDAELYYNDYSLENEAKRNGAVALIRSLQEAGVRVDGIGSQGHNHLDWPTVEQQAATIQAFAELGVKVMITELDITVLPRDGRVWGADVELQQQLREELNPYEDALPDSMQTVLANRYAELFRVYVDHSDAISRVTFWGVSDADSWLNGWPVPGRTDYPLLFDRNHQPKPAFEAVLATATAE